MAADAPVRVRDAFVGGLDVNGLGFGRSVPAATIKQMTAGGRFLARGLDKASAEAALSVLAYNIIRTINLIGAATLRTSLA